MKKFKKMQNVIAVVLALVLLMSPMSVFAEELPEELPTEAVYNLEQGGTQIFTIREEDGTVATITVEELSGNARVADGDYRIGYDNTVWQAHFYASISNNKFYNAYDPYAYAFAGRIKYPALTRPSTTQVIFAFIYESIATMFSTGIDAKIVNGNVVITRR